MSEAMAEGGGELITDIGLTWMTQQADFLTWLRYEDAQAYLRNGLDGAVLSLTEVAVTEFRSSYPFQMGDDVRLLLNSGLSEETLRSVWLTATAGYFDPAEYGMSGRTWLQRIETAWIACIRSDDPSYVQSSPTPVKNAELRDTVLAEVRDVAERLTRVIGEENRPVQALEAVVAEVDVPLGYRLFLSAVKRCLTVTQARHVRYRSLCEKFGYPGSIAPEVNVDG